MNTTEAGRELPQLDNAEKGDIALRMIIGQVMKSGDISFFGKPNNQRREIIARALELEIDPNKILSLYRDIMTPKIEALFKPITPENIKEWKLEQEEQKRKKEASKTQTARPQAEQQS